MIQIKDWQIDRLFPSIIIQYKNENKILMSADDAEDFARALLVVVKASRRRSDPLKRVNTSIK